MHLDSVVWVGVIEEELCEKMMELRMVIDGVFAIVLIFYEDVMRLVCVFPRNVKAIFVSLNIE